MPLSATSLQSSILAELESKGFSVNGDHTRVKDYAEALAIAIVTHIQESAEVTVKSGSSAGTYSVE